MIALLAHTEGAKPCRDAGNIAVEAALVLPILFLLIFGIIKFGIAFWQWNTMLRAVETAGRYAMINNSVGNASLPNCTATTPTLATCSEQQMTNMISGASVCTTPSAGQICVSATTSTSSTPNTMTLTANYNFNFFGIATPFTITAQGTVPLD